eukprot:jgi/Bigna1/74728/fgenesh1_pg.30_\
MADSQRLGSNSISNRRSCGTRILLVLASAAVMIIGNHKPPRLATILSNSASSPNLVAHPSRSSASSISSSSSSSSSSLAPCESYEGNGRLSRISSIYGHSSVCSKTANERLRQGTKSYRLRQERSRRMANTLKAFSTATPEFGGEPPQTEEEGAKKADVSQDIQTIVKNIDGEEEITRLENKKREGRRNFLAGAAVVGLSIPAFVYPPDVVKNAIGLLKNPATSDSTVDRSIRALARAERQAVETVAEVQIDPNDGNEYWILRSQKGFTNSWIAKLAGSKDTNFRVLKRRVSDSEVVAAGLVAGALVEAARIFLLHPLDTIKTRLQAYQRPKPPTEEELEQQRQDRIETLSRKIKTVDEQLRPARRKVRVSPRRMSTGFGTPRRTMRGVKVLQKIALQERLDETKESELKNKPSMIPPEVFTKPWDGLNIALLTSAPQGAVYWAVRDVVKRNLLQAAPAGVGGAAVATKSVATTGVSGILVTKIATWIAALSALIGPAAAAIALDYRSAATLFAVACGEAMYWFVRTPSEVLKTRRQTAILEERGFREKTDDYMASPSWCARAAAHISHPGSRGLPQIVGRVWADLIFFTIGAVVASGLTTPLDVARTRLLLQRQRDVEIEIDRATKWDLAIEAGRAAAQATAEAIEITSKRGKKKEEKEAAEKAEATAKTKVQEAAAYAESLGVEVVEILPARGGGGLFAAATGFAENIFSGMSDEERISKEEEVRSKEEKMVEFVRNAAPPPSQNPRYDGIVDCLKKISKEEGLPGLFAGLGYRMLWNGLVVGFILAIQRTSYEGVRTAIMFRVLDQINEIVPNIDTAKGHSAFLTAYGLAAGAVDHLHSMAMHVPALPPPS